MMRFFMTTMRRAEALNEEGAGKNLSMYTMSISHADDFNFQLHNINIEVIGTALSLPGQGRDLDLQQDMSSADDFQLLGQGQRES